MRKTSEGREDPGIAERDAPAEPDAADLRPLSEAALDDRVMWSLVEAAPDGMVIADEHGQIMLVNRQIEALFGCDRGELLGRSVDDLLPERLRSVHRAHRTRYRAAPSVRTMGAGLRLHALRSDGIEFPVEISLSPVDTDGGLRIVAAIRDITERVESEARAREVREIVDATRDGVSIFDAATLRFTYVNDGLVDQVGYGRDELLTMTMLHLAPEFTESTLRSMLASLEDGDTLSDTVVTVHRRRDGTDIPVEILLQAIVGDDGRARAFVKIARDITERVAAETRQRATEQELRVLADRERMGRDLHDLVIQRLFATGMAVQSLQARFRDDPVAASLAEIVDELDTTIREIRTVIFGLQRPVGTDADGLRSAVLAVIDDERAALGLAPHVQLDGHLDTITNDIAQHVLAILRESLSNIARHAHATQVEITVHAHDEMLVLLVADNGIGLIGARSDGNGLRNMCDRARALGGTLTAITPPTGGTTIECRIPTSPAA
jgi:PAS domain S-box-containing protein